MGGLVRLDARYGAQRKHEHRFGVGELCLGVEIEIGIGEDQVPRCQALQIRAGRHRQHPPDLLARKPAGDIRRIDVRPLGNPDGQ